METQCRWRLRINVDAVEVETVKMESQFRQEHRADTDSFEVETWCMWIPKCRWRQCKWRLSAGRHTEQVQNQSRWRFSAPRDSSGVVDTGQVETQRRWKISTDSVQVLTLCRWKPGCR